MITDTLEAMCARLRRLAELREQSLLAKEMVAGLHVELLRRDVGPFFETELLGH